MILPMIAYLEKAGAQFHYNTKVVDVRFDVRRRQEGRAADRSLRGRMESGLSNLTEDDLLFITPGGCVENSTLGSQDAPAPYAPELKPGGGWDMWRRIAAQDPSFGHPDKFCAEPEKSNWMSATVTTLDEQDSALYPENLPAGSLQRQGGHRRHRHRQGFQLAAELDLQPPAAVPRTAQRAAGGLDLRPVQRQAGQLCEKAHARVHRQGDLHGVALPPGRARGGDRGAWPPAAPTPSPA